MKLINSKNKDMFAICNQCRLVKGHGFGSAQPSVFIGRCLSGAEGYHHKEKSLSKQH